MHICDTEKDIILWSRSNATRTTPTPPVTTREGMPTATPAGSAAGSADVVMTAGQPKRERPEHDEPDAEDEVEEVGPTPPHKAQRENIPTGDPMCPGCKFAAGTIICPACNANIAGSADIKQNLLSKRRELLKQLGYEHLDLNASVIERLHSQSMQFREEPARGQRSPEGDFIETSRRQLKRAAALGFTSLADRYEHDVGFVERMSEHGITTQDIYARDIAARGHLPTPPRTKTQVDFGIGIKINQFAKLMYVDSNIAGLGGRALAERFTEEN